MKKINTKRLKFRINNTVVIAFFVICVVMVNMIAGLMEDKFPRMSVDFTEDAITKLTGETKAFLKMNDTEIDIIYLKGTGEKDTVADRLLGQYVYYGNNIKYYDVNYLKDPTYLSSFGISPSSVMEGTIIVTNKDHSRFRAVLPKDMWSGAEFLLESKITNAIGYVINSESINVCIATGYGADEYITNLIGALVDDNLSVSRIDLSTTLVPDGIDVLLLMSPYADLTESEVVNLEDYASRGGNIIVALPSYAISQPNLEVYLKYWGISVNSDLIYEYDETSSYEQTGAGFFAQALPHDITEGIKGRILATNARSLKFTPVGDLSADVILQSTDKAVSVPQTEEEITKEDIVYGPFDIAYVVERPLDGSFETTSKLMVTSTPSLWGVESIENVINQSRFGNRAFISKAISYISGKSLQSVVVPEKNSTTNVMALSNLQSFVFTVVLCILLPAVVLLWGIVIWLKRRNK